jgi:hypothetical protein
MEDDLSVIASPISRIWKERGAGKKEKGTRRSERVSSLPQQPFYAFEFWRLSIVWLFNSATKQLLLSLPLTPQLNCAHQ